MIPSGGIDHAMPYPSDLGERPPVAPVAAYTWSDGLILALDGLTVAAAGLPALFPSRVPAPATAMALALLLVPYGVRRLAWGRWTAPHPAVWAVAVILGLALPLSLAVAPDLAAARVPAVRLVWSLALIMAGLNWLYGPGPHGWRRPDANRVLSPALPWLGIAFLLVGVAAIGVGVLAMRPANKFAWVTSWLQTLPRPTTLAFLEGFLNPNRVGGMAALYVPLCGVLALAPGRGPAGLLQRTLYGVLGLGFAGALVLSQSRGAMLAAGLATAVVLVGLGRRGQVALLVGLLLLAAGVAWAGGPRAVVAALARSPVPQAGVAETVLAERDLRGRIRLWRTAADLWIHAPLTGIGLETFGQMPIPVDPARPEAGLMDEYNHAHNLVLQVGLDLGLPGLVAFLALLVLAWRRVTQGLARATRADERAWLLALLGSLLVYYLLGLVEAFTLSGRSGFLAALLLALCLGCTLPSRSASARTA